MFRLKRLAILACLSTLIAASPPKPERGEDGFGNAYPQDDVFAKIARHEAPYDPSQIAYEDKDVMVFAAHGPWATGHMLVIARNSRARSLIDMPPKILSKMMAVARRVMMAQRDALGATGAVIFISNGSVQSVPHLHIHVVPRYNGQPVPLPSKTEQIVSPSELAVPTAQIARAMASPRK